MPASSAPRQRHRPPRLAATLERFRRAARVVGRASTPGRASARIDKFLAQPVTLAKTHHLRLLELLQKRPRVLRVATTAREQANEVALPRDVPLALGNMLLGQRRCASMRARSISQP